MTPLRLVTDGRLRDCGDCQACCEVVGVASLGKKENQKCEHQCVIGCAIYDQRPDECQKYNCAWRLGFIDGPRYRPDKFGVLFDLREKEGVGLFTAWEVRAGAFKETAVEYLIKHLRKTLNIDLRHLP